ncbi:MAG: TspO/MBR family protein [Pseudomonadota bacterium]
MQIYWSLLVFFAFVFLAAMSGGIFRPGEWYRGLAKPSWNPPDWAFPVAWTALYGTMAVAAWLVYEAAGFTLAGMVAIGFWFIQLVLNALWSALFFGAKRMDYALWDAAGMWLAIVGTIIAFAPINTISALLMVPYLLWVSFAIFLNWTLIKMNPDNDGTQLAAPGGSGG